MCSNVSFSSSQYLHVRLKKWPKCVSLLDEGYGQNCRPETSILQRHTYIHNWSLQPFSQDFGLASHTAHVACVNFIRDWRDLQFNVDSERQISEKLSHGSCIYSLRVFARNLLKSCNDRWQNIPRLLNKSSESEYNCVG